MNSEFAWKDIRINVDYEYWGLLNGSYSRYSSFESAEKAAIAQGMNKNAVEHYPPLTIKETIEKIREAENAVCGSPEDKWSVGPWDEYFTPSGEYVEAAYKWWPKGKIFVTVVEGNNEGLSIRIMVDVVRNLKIDEEGGFRTIISGKTCIRGAEAWQKCWESAMRISWYLAR